MSYDSTANDVEVTVIYVKVLQPSTHAFIDKLMLIGSYRV